MFCQAFIFSLYLSCYFHLSAYLLLRVHTFVNKIKVVTENEDKLLAVFRLDDLCSLKCIKCLPQETCIMGLESNFCPSVFFLFSSSAPQLTGWRMLRHSLPGSYSNAFMTTAHALLF